MEVTLKKLRVDKRLSEETHCFSADLYLDGKRRGDVTNRGCGGPDDFSDRAVERELNEWGKTQPPIEAFGMELPVTAESIVGELVSQALLERDRKAMVRKLVRKLKRPGFLVLVGIGQDEHEVRASGERVPAMAGATEPAVKRLMKEGYTEIEAYDGGSGQRLEHLALGASP